ncbi:MAG: C45 family peptidase [Spirochaetia bacterium]|nr:C45 family peptidase [Spirochaetia bacterium]
MDIKEAFKIDGFNVIDSCKINAHTGYAAESISAVNHLNGKKKRAYYIEGSPDEMGYQMGFLGHAEIKQMVKEFPRETISGFLDPAMSPVLKDIIIDFLLFFIRESIYTFIDDIPFEYVQEAHGMVRGLHKADPTAVGIQFEDIWILNVGIDVLMANLSSPPKFLQAIADSPEVKKQKYKPKIEDFKIPHFCNAYSAFGSAVEKPDTHFFGRDWMFNGGNTLENCAALIITKPTGGRKPLVYAGAPGFIGAALAMNMDGVAMGVDLVSAANANPSRPGFNSILLVRHCIHRCDSAETVSQTVIKAKRGAPYIYPVSDGKSNKACIIEAGMKTANLDPLSYASDDVKAYLPNKAFLNANAEAPQEGLFVRWNTYQQPAIFMKNYNKGLFEHFGKKYSPDVWGADGLVFKEPFADPNAFGFYFFSPLRQDKADYILTTNSWVHPPMNICSMGEFTNTFSKLYWSDPQWRYDMLNEVIRGFYGKFNWETAWRTINYQSPSTGEGDGKKYYVIEGSPWKLPIVKYTDKDGKPQSTWRVDGMTNLCELRTAKKMRSLYGTYADDYVEITLPNYV